MNEPTPSTHIHTATLPCAHCGDRTRHEVVGYVHEDGMRYMPVEVFRAWSKRVASAAPEEWAPVVSARR